MYYAVGHLRMFVDERGIPNTQTILFVHGFPFDHSMWQRQMSAFSQAYHCIAPDLRGHGGTVETENPAGPVMVTMDLLADDLLALLDQLAPGRQVTLCGLSLGGYIAFALWRKQPGRFARLILADTKATPDSPEARARRQAQMQTVNEHGAKGISGGMLDGLLAPEHREDVIGMAVRRMIESTSSPHIIATLQALADRPDSTQTLATISVPTLIVVGESDKTTPLSDAQYMAERLPERTRLEVIPQAGHLSPLENPTAFNAILRDFLMAN